MSSKHLQCPFGVQGNLHDEARRAELALMRNLVRNLQRNLLRNLLRNLRRNLLRNLRRNLLRNLR